MHNTNSAFGSSNSGATTTAASSRWSTVACHDWFTSSCSSSLNASGENLPLLSLLRLLDRALCLLHASIIGAVRRDTLGIILRRKAIAPRNVPASFGFEGMPRPIISSIFGFWSWSPCGVATNPSTLTSGSSSSHLAPLSDIPETAILDRTLSNRSTNAPKVVARMQMSSIHDVAPPSPRP